MVVIGRRELILDDDRTGAAEVAGEEVHRTFGSRQSETSQALPHPALGGAPGGARRHEGAIGSGCAWVASRATFCRDVQRSVL